MSWTLRKKELTEQARRYNRSAILVTKNSWIWKFVALVLTPLMSKDDFLHNFATTIGPIVAFPEVWTFEQVARVIPHEVGGHVNQFWAFGGFIPYVSPWIGIVPMTIFYGLLLPVLFNWFRYRLELHADKQAWRYMILNGYNFSEVVARAERFARTISSWKYGKCIPEKWAIWGFRRAASKILAETR